MAHQNSGNQHPVPQSGHIIAHGPNLPVKRYVVQLLSVREHDGTELFQGTQVAKHDWLDPRPSHRDRMRSLVSAELGYILP